MAADIADLPRPGRWPANARALAAERPVGGDDAPAPAHPEDVERDVRRRLYGDRSRVRRVARVPPSTPDETAAR